MMLIEFHDFDGNMIAVNFMAVLFAVLSPKGGSVLTFNHGTVLEVKEDPTEIMMNIKTMMMQQAIKGH